MILGGPEDFAALTGAAPVAPHFGDFVLGFPAAIENTCAEVQGLGPLTLGRGLMQVDRAFDYLVEYAAAADSDGDDNDDRCLAELAVNHRARALGRATRLSSWRGR